MAKKASGRRDLRRIDYALRGLVTIVVIALVLGGAYLRTSGRLGGDPQISALVADAGGALRPGSDVKLDGVIVGRVTGIERAGQASQGNDGVRVRMSVPRSALDQIPANVVARILPATVFGTTYVDLTIHGSAASRSLAADSVVPADTTQGTLELQAALDDIDGLVKALGPAQLASAIGAAATALDGRGKQIGQTIDTFDTYLARLQPRLPQVSGDVAALADTLETVDRIAPDLVDATDDGLVALRTIANHEAALLAVITTGTTLIEHSADLLGPNQEHLVQFVRDASLLTDSVYRNRVAAITGALQTNLMLGKLLPTVVREGFVRTDGNMRLKPPPYYTAADRPRYDDAGSRAAATRLFGTGGKP